MQVGDKVKVRTCSTSYNAHEGKVGTLTYLAVPGYCNHAVDFDNGDCCSAVTVEPTTRPVQVGDKVKVTTCSTTYVDSTHTGEVGTLLAIRSGLAWPYEVQLDKGGVCDAAAVEPVEPSFKIGDKVAITKCQTACASHIGALGTLVGISATEYQVKLDVGGFCIAKSVAGPMFVPAKLPQPEPRRDVEQSLVLSQIESEIARSDKRWGDHSTFNEPDDKQYAITNEEFLEVVEAYTKLCKAYTDERRDDLETEIVQAAACLVSWLTSIRVRRCYGV